MHSPILAHPRCSLLTGLCRQPSMWSAIPPSRGFGARLPSMYRAEQHSSASTGTSGLKMLIRLSGPRRRHPDLCRHQARCQPSQVWWLCDERCCQPHGRLRHVHGDAESAWASHMVTLGRVKYGHDCSMWPGTRLESVQPSALRRALSNLAEVITDAESGCCCRTHQHLMPIMSCQV